MGNSFKRKIHFAKKKIHISNNFDFICVWKKLPCLENDFSIFSKNKNFQSQVLHFMSNLSPYFQSIFCTYWRHTFFPNAFIPYVPKQNPTHTQYYIGFINISTLLLLLLDQNLVWFYDLLCLKQSFFFLLARQGEVGLVFQENK